MNKYRGFVEIQIEKETKGFKFNNNASVIYCESKGIELGEMAGEMRLSGEDQKKINQGDFSVLKNVHMTYWRDMIWAAHAGYQRARGLEEPVKEQVGEWIDEMPQKDFNKIISAFVGASALGESLGVKLSKSMEAIKSHGRSSTATVSQD